MAGGDGGHRAQTEDHQTYAADVGKLGIDLMQDANRTLNSLMAFSGAVGSGFALDTLTGFMADSNLSQRSAFTNLMQISTGLNALGSGAGAIGMHYLGADIEGANGINRIDNADTVDKLFSKPAKDAGGTGETDKNLPAWLKKALADAEKQQDQHGKAIDELNETIEQDNADAEAGKSPYIYNPEDGSITVVTDMNSEVIGTVTVPEDDLLPTGPDDTFEDPRTKKPELPPMPN